MNFEVQIDKAGFKGVAVIDFPTRAEKMKLVTELKALGHGKEDMEGEGMTDAKLAVANKMGEVVDARLISIDVTFMDADPQVHITDKAMLDIYTEGSALTGVIAHMILGGVSLGKEKSSTSDAQ